MPKCSICSKEFKNVALHVRKTHDDIAIKYVDSGKVTRWSEDGRPSVFDKKIDAYEVYKNGVLIDTLDYNCADDDYSSSVKNKEGKILLLVEVRDKDYGKGINYRLYYGVKKNGFVGQGVDGECAGNLYCNTFRKIDW
jgi:hypothetical protein